MNDVMIYTTPVSSGVSTTSVVSHTPHHVHSKSAVGAIPVSVGGAQVPAGPKAGPPGDKFRTECFAYLINNKGEPNVRVKSKYNFRK